MNMNNQKGFIYTFRVAKRISFTVSYHRLGYNQTPYFATSSDLLNYHRSDYEECGQAQETLLKKDSLAYKFFIKWDKKHLQLLNDAEYSELIKDLEELIELYPHINNDKFDNFVRLDREYSK